MKMDGRSSLGSEKDRFVVILGMELNYKRI